MSRYLVPVYIEASSPEEAETIADAITLALLPHADVVALGRLSDWIGNPVMRFRPADGA